MDIEVICCFEGLLIHVSQALRALISHTIAAVIVSLRILTVVSSTEIAVCTKAGRSWLCFP